MATRTESVAAVAGRYIHPNCLDRGWSLDEFVAVTGHHRKPAMRLRLGSGVGAPVWRGRQDCLYDAAMREALIVL